MKILVFPKSDNPYQELLYSPLRRRALISYLDVRFDGPLRAATFVPRLIVQLARKRLQGHVILHVHWLYTLGVPAFMPFAKNIAYVQTQIFLFAARILGYRLVWTAHNVLPHSEITSNDLGVRRRLARNAAAIIVHSTSTEVALRERGITDKKCIVVPHGSYIGIYDNDITSQAARRILTIPEDAQVIGFLGHLLAYKNIPELIEAFGALAASNSNIFLLLAGKCRDERIAGLVSEYNKKTNGRIHLHDQYVADEDIQIYLNAADITVFPFSEITTSGSVLLAASFGKPIVAPYVGALRDMPRQIGRLYEPKPGFSLSNVLAELLDKPTDLIRMGRASQAYAESLSWEVIANKTYSVYERILGG